jgi:DNA-binding NtrC family response regulator
MARLMTFSGPTTSTMTDPRPARHETLAVPAFARAEPAAVAPGPTFAGTDPTADAAPAARPVVLVADDTPANLDMLVALLEREGYDVLAAASGETALRAARAAGPHIALLDVMMPGIDGYETCRRLKADPATAHVPVLFISARDESDSAVSAFAAGGVDYISKPFHPPEVLARVGAHLRIAGLTRALSDQNAALAASNEALATSNAALAAANADLRTEIGRREQAEDALQTAGDRLSALAGREAERWDVAGFVGKSDTLGRILADVRRVGNYGSVNVLVTGESGTGKELVARAIHDGSPRARGPFIPVNCVAVPADLAESMFFGHLRGSFTGATSDRKGYFELADGGTLFLDEIGDMPATLQAKLLRVLEDGRVTALGASREKRVDVRVVAATNADLQRKIATGAFRQDLYFRLAQFCVELPPVRARKEDIPLLVEHFARVFAREMNVDPPAVDPAVLAALAAHDFPGNVRELKNLVERCLIESGGGTIKVRHLRFLPRPGGGGAGGGGGPSGFPAPTDDAGFAPAPSAAGSAPAGGATVVHPSVSDLPLNLEEAETLLIRRALAETGGNIAEAARRLGVNRTRIYRKIGGAGPAE